MAKIRMSLEVPIAHLEETEKLVDFHFCIASIAAEHPDYFEYYRDEAAEPGSFVMLDNGAYEAHAGDGLVMSPMELYELADELKPHLVWAPDVLFERKETERLAKEFVDICTRRGHNWQIGFIPQGETLMEMLVSCDSAPHHHWLGLSFLNPRLAVLAELCGKLTKPLHMLGLRSLEEIKYWPRMPLTMDTSKPIKAALVGEELATLGRGRGLLLPDDVIEDRELMIRNIQALRAACDV